MKQIVSRKIKARNPITGEFEGINVFAAESTEEYLAKIQKKGEDTLSAVGAEMDAHGQRVLDSLPEEYTNLVVQTTGDSATQVMSQKAATDCFNERLPRVDSTIQLFNPNDAAAIIEGAISDGKIYSSTIARVCFVACKPNTKYTVSINSVGNRFTVGESDTLPIVGTTPITTLSGASNVAISNDRKYAFVTTNDTAKYLCVYYWHNSSEIEEETMRNSLLINENHIAYDYYPYTSTDLMNLLNDERITASPIYGDEVLITNVSLGSGWSGDNTNGFVHDSTYDAPLILKTELPLEMEYILSITSLTENPNENAFFTVDVGGESSGRMYEGEFTEHTYVRGFKGRAAYHITITPEKVNGTIKNISLKPIMSDAHVAYITSGNDRIEANGGYNSVYIGKDNAKKALPRASGNSALGDSALRDNLSGFWNVAMGYKAMLQNTSGSRNVAIGYIALQKNKNGHRNVAIGSFALESNETGYHNIAIGADALQRCVDGNNNIAMGITTMGHNNGERNVAIGYFNLGENTTGSNNTAIGSFSGITNKTGSRNTLIGDSTDAPNDISDSIVIGHYAKATKSRQCVIGTTEIKEVVIAGKKISFNDDGSVTWSNVN